MNVPFWVWLAVLAVIVAMLAVDLFAHRRAHVIGVREAAAWSGLWVATGAGFAFGIGGGACRGASASSTRGWAARSIPASCSSPPSSR